jgi:hypothetical protein
MYCEDLGYRFSKTLFDISDPNVRLRSFSQMLETCVSSHMFGAHSQIERPLLTSEFHTWALFVQLFEVDSYLQGDRDENKYSQIHFYDHVIAGDPGFLTLKFVMNWLEAIKEINRETIREASLKKTLKNFYSGVRGSSLDPDGTFRERRILDDEDVKNEKLILRDAFWLIRAGHLDKAQQLLMESGQTWRAVTLGGLLPYFDFSLYDFPKSVHLSSGMLTIEARESIDNYENALKQERLYTSSMGNANVELYMQSLWTLSKKNRPELENDLFERGIYGSLCGNYEAMAPVCNRDIYDQIWACVRSLYCFHLKDKLRQYVEQYEPVEYPEDSSYWPQEVAMPGKIPDNWPKSFGDIFRLVQRDHASAFENPFVRFQLEAITNYLKNDWEAILNQIYTLADTPYEDTQIGLIQRFHTLRFCVHLAILLPEQFRNQRFDNLITSYIHLLIQNEFKLDSVLFYIRYITDPYKVQEITSSILSIYTNPNQRRTFIECMKQYFPDSYISYLIHAMDQLVNIEAELITPENICKILADTTKDYTYSILKDMISILNRNISEEDMKTCSVLIRKLILTARLELAKLMIGFLAAASIEVFDEFSQELSKELDFWNRFIGCIETGAELQRLKEREVELVDSIYSEASRRNPKDLISPAKLEQSPYHKRLLWEENFNLIAPRLQTDIEKLIYHQGQNEFFLDILTLDPEAYREIEKVWLGVMIEWLLVCYEFPRNLSRIGELESDFGLNFRERMDESYGVRLEGRFKEVLNRLRRS